MKERQGKVELSDLEKADCLTGKIGGWDCAEGAGLGEWEAAAVCV